MQRERASKLAAAAKRLAVEAARSSKRRRVVQRPAERVHSPDHILLGARVAVYWRDDKQFYKVMSRQLQPGTPSCMSKRMALEQGYAPLSQVSMGIKQ